jgi:hypothetical protein
MPAAGGVPDGFAAVRELEFGPRGQVVLCRRSDGTEVVVRMLPTEGLDADAVAGLQSELAAAAAASEHACAARVNRVWTDKHLGVCLEQAYFPGGSLASLPAGVDADAVALGGARLAAALAHSHSRGVLHGDVRPANVLLAADGAWLLAGGGLAAAVHRARPAVPAADPAFAPREMLGWEKPAPSADVYGLGATLQAALVGAAAVPAALSALIERMLAPAPADRPPLAEVDQTLRRLVAAPARNRLPAAVLVPVAAAMPRPKLPAALVAVPVAAAAANRNRVLIAAAAVGVIFLGGATAVAVSNSGGSGGKAVMTAASAPPIAVPSASPTASPTPKVAAPKVAAPKPAAPKPAKSAPTPKAAAPKVVAAPLAAAAAPAAAPQAATAAGDMRYVRPFDVATLPVDVGGVQKMKVTWRIDNITPAVSGWKIYVGALHGNSYQVESVLLDGVVSAKDNKEPYFDVAYTMKGDYPLSWCAVVETQLGQTQHSDPSKIYCPPVQAPSNPQPAQKTAPAPAPSSKASAKPSAVTKASPPQKPAPKASPKSVILRSAPS